MAPKEKAWELYRTLDQQLEDGEFEESLETCNKLLSIDKNDQIAFRTKIYILINLEDFDTVLDLLDDVDLTTDDLVFARAYSLYKNKKYKEALDVILANQSVAKSISILNLKAQCYYRLENFVESTKCYKQIMDLEPNSEVYTNYISALVGYDKNEAMKAVKNNEEIKDSYESLYNISFIHLEHNDYTNSLKKLQQAKDLCQKTLKEEGFSKEEIHEELCIILAQEAYIKLLRGDNSKEIFESILNDSSSNVSAIISCINNIILTRQNNEEVEDSFNKLKSLFDEKYSDKMLTNQKLIALYNFCVLCLKLGKYQEAYDHINKLKVQLDKYGDINHGPKKAHIRLLLAHYYHLSGDENGLESFLSESEEKLVRENPSTIKYMKKKMSRAKNEQQSEVPKVKKPRKKKNKPAKNADFSKPPDPERWLPRKDRSYTKRRAKNARSTGHQGAKVTSTTL